ncbi:hypothetical protein Poli38472_006544 [Pythium oligandrum]|uniref:Uncharacterized protein n=1 Tax=Pythium oligandrum TaxID=41045 RepID=A0A8K1FD57_PYTOL|nr:hypothetical protein Poli38472_006544 [Pythium oligandrum]|eukprot:TMW56534.1 hypothetical protein Poli38472_006544 [Pythium oligandrum]
MDMEMERVVDDGANAVDAADDAGRAQGHAGLRGIHSVSVRFRHDKRDLLATQHARYALLVRTVDRWRSVAAARRARREQLIAACRVGARFFQRLYWNQWKETLTRRREARERACARLQSLQSKIRLLRGFHRWKHVVEARRQAVSNAQSACDERRLQVQETRINRNDESGRRATCLTASDPSVRRLRQAKIARIRVYHTQRQYFQRWLEMVKNWSTVCDQRFKEQSRSFQLHSAVRRWRRRTEGRIRGRTMAKQAYFFLYFHLTSSALERLRRNAMRERRERDVAVTIETRGLNQHYGFQFPVRRQALSPVDQVSRSSPHHTPSAVPVFESDKDAIGSIMELEERLRGFEQRRQRWKRLQQSLEEFRRNLHDASTQGLLSSQELGHMKQRLALMEEQNSQYQKQWLASKPEIKSLAAQLSRLRRAVMA